MKKYKVIVGARIDIPVQDIRIILAENEDMAERLACNSFCWEQERKGNYLVSPIETFLVEEVDKSILCPNCKGKKYIHVTSELPMGWGFQSQSLEEPYMKCIECGYEEKVEEFE